MLANLLNIVVAIIIGKSSHIAIANYRLKEKSLLADRVDQFMSGALKSCNKMTSSVVCIISIKYANNFVGS